MKGTDSLLKLMSSVQVLPHSDEGPCCALDGPIDGFIYAFIVLVSRNK